MHSVPFLGPRAKAGDGRDAILQGNCRKPELAGMLGHLAGIV